MSCGSIYHQKQRIAALERQLASAQERGKLLWRTSGEWLGSWHATRRILLSHVEGLTEAQGKLDAIENFAEDQYKDGVCLRCGAPAANHEEMSPSCWVLALARILKGE